MMIDDKTFPLTYFSSPDVEGQQSPALQARLKELWTVHHDDYAPADRKVMPVSPGGNSKTIRLVLGFDSVALASAQAEMAILNGPEEPAPLTALNP